MYKEYLKAIDVISEEDFNEVMKSIPGSDEINFDEVLFCDYSHDKNSLAYDLIDHIMNNKFRECYLDDCSYDNKSLRIGDIQSIEDLEKIKEFFSGWTIEEYDEILEELKEIEKENSKKGEIIKLRDTIFNKLYDIENIDKLKNILDYVNKD